MKKAIYFTFILSLIAIGLRGQENTDQSKFRQLGTEIPTPNVYRTASGAPGHEYWQQKADYRMKIKLDDETQRIHGEETITYYNNSPDALRYIWLQLDQNVRAKDSDSRKIRQKKYGKDITVEKLMKSEPWFDGGIKLEHVHDASGNDLHYVVNKTMMRIDLPETLKKGEKFVFNIKWWYNINDRMKIGGRSGMEYFEKEDNYIYTIAQFFPRMAVYSDNEGWQHKQFLGRGEFTLTFGDYHVEITVPSDHIVSATGLLKNQKSVLTATQRKRYLEAKTADHPVMIVTPDEALENEKKHDKGLKTWVFEAENVRDFAFASSRKFIWDAMGVKIGNKTIMAMSFYPKEGNPLWEQYSTKVVAHTIKTYSKYTVDYIYPVAQSVHSKWIGMEYPMICFNGGRPEADGTYSANTKHGMISVIIHEVGHNFFPMIINSDERQWTWMDEGLNTFVQYLTEKEFDINYPTRRGPARNIVDYMKGDPSKISPIMTNSESIFQFGNNAYGKPATALNILRESVMGRELFDYAFKEYCRRWEFKHPTPADLFRTMEDASAVDLDWFWRGWFYTNDHVDFALTNVKWFQIGTPIAAEMKKAQKALDDNIPNDISIERDKAKNEKTYIERDPSLNDFYTTRDKYEVSKLDEEDYQAIKDDLTDEQKEWLEDGKFAYQIEVKNIGGLVMPLIFELRYEDGSSEIKRVPAEIWKMGDESVNVGYVTDKKVVEIVFDPYLELADTDINNNYWPGRVVPSKFDLFKKKIEARQPKENPMQRAERAKK